MKKQTSIFRIVVVMIFAVLTVGGVIAFATFRAQQESDVIGEVDIWGTYNEDVFSKFLRELQKQDQTINQVSYRHFNEEDFEQEVLEAMASGAAPDLLFIKEHQLHNYLDKVYTMTGESYSRSKYINDFVDLAEIYFQNGGIVALPLAADPVVMYWNRDIFASAGIPRPPSSWTEFFELSQDLSQVDESLNITQSAIAFGETQNVNYFREILATLILQIGNPLITQEEETGEFRAALEGDRDTESAFAALRFYTEFSDASKSVYSWNRSMPDSEDAFLASKLAVYFAPASQIVPLRAKNPNLNFAVAEIPTIDTSISPRKTVHAGLYGFAIPRVSDNLGGAFQTAITLTANDAMRMFADLSGLAPVRRDLIGEPSQEAYRDIMKKETLYARTFIDPSREETTSILADMVESITSGQRSIENAIYVSSTELNDLIEREE